MNGRLRNHSNKITYTYPKETLFIRVLLYVLCGKCVFTNYFLLCITW